MLVAEAVAGSQEAVSSGLMQNSTVPRSGRPSVWLEEGIGQQFCAERQRERSDSMVACYKSFVWGSNGTGCAGVLKQWIGRQ